ncbi:MAG: PAS domain-containing protein [Capnocytophaga sp.]|nr:PAS domain-containing protein [Capnocytophaga sp.]
MSIQKPTPIDEEVAWDKSKTIKSKTDSKGTIGYVNNVFLEVSGYTESELIGQPHNVIRHPDMPRVVFKVLWDNLKIGNNFNAVVKNLSKSGKYYWIVTNFDIFKDENGTPLSFMGVRTSVPDAVINVIKPLYARLVELEKTGGMEASEAFLKEYFQQQGFADYTAFIKKLMSDNGVDVSFW